MRLRLATVGLVIIGCLVASASASAVTLGTTTIPTGANPVANCGAGYFFVQAGADAAISYVVPAPGGQITSWSLNTTVAAPSTPETLLILQPTGTGYTVVAADTETLPAILTGTVTTFPLATPIPVATGEVIAVRSTATYSCAFAGGGIPVSDVVGGSLESSTAVGTTYTASGSINPKSLLNVSANLVQPADVAVTGGAAPASITAGSAAEYAFSVADNGPGAVPVSFTDTVPAGLKILSAIAGSGTCSTAGQNVTCTITGLASGATAPVSIIVGAPAAGSYPDTATVSTTEPDPNPANNSASATLTVTAANPLATCKVVSLAGAPLAVAKAVIPALNCTVGKTTKKASKKVKKGFVISTSPGAGKTLAAGTKVNIVVSSGPPKKKKKKRRK